MEYEDTGFRLRDIVLLKVQGDHPAVLALRGAYGDEMARRYGEEHGAGYRTAIDVGDDGYVLLALLGRQAVSEGANRLLDSDFGKEPGAREVKSMSTLVEYLRNGIARSTLAGLEYGHSNVYLNTGENQPEALALYRSAGYEPIPVYDPSNALAKYAFRKEIPPGDRTLVSVPNPDRPIRRLAENVTDEQWTRHLAVDLREILGGDTLRVDPNGRLVQDSPESRSVSFPSTAAGVMAFTDHLQRRGLLADEEATRRRDAMRRWAELRYPGVDLHRLPIANEPWLQQGLASGLGVQAGTALFSSVVDFDIYSNGAVRGISREPSVGIATVTRTPQAQQFEPTQPIGVHVLGSEPNDVRRVERLLSRADPVGQQVDVDIDVRARSLVDSAETRYAVVASDGEFDAVVEVARDEDVVRLTDRSIVARDNPRSGVFDAAAVLAEQSGLERVEVPLSVAELAVRQVSDTHGVRTDEHGQHYLDVRVNRTHAETRQPVFVAPDVPPFGPGLPIAGLSASPEPTDPSKPTAETSTDQPEVNRSRIRRDVTPSNDADSTPPSRPLRSRRRPPHYDGPPTDLPPMDTGEREPKTRRNERGPEVEGP